MKQCALNKNKTAYKSSHSCTSVLINSKKIQMNQKSHPAATIPQEVPFQYKFASAMVLLGSLFSIRRQ